MGISALWWRRMKAFLTPPRSLMIVQGDTLPARLPHLNFVLARDGDEDWSVGVRCPCGCGDRLEMMLLPEIRPRWDLSLDAKGHVTLYPSVWRKSGCGSHFWVRKGKIIWCD